MRHGCMAQTRRAAGCEDPFQAAPPPFSPASPLPPNHPRLPQGPRACSWSLEDSKHACMRTSTYLPTCLSVSQSVASQSVGARQPLARRLGRTRTGDQVEKPMGGRSDSQRRRVGCTSTPTGQRLARSLGTDAARLAPMSPVAESSPRARRIQCRRAELARVPAGSTRH